MSTTTELEVHRIVRSERRWAAAETVGLWIVSVCLIAFVIGVVAGATIVLTQSPDEFSRGVMDGE